MGKFCPVCKRDMFVWGKKQQAIVYYCKNCGLGQSINIRDQDGSYHRDEEYLREEKLFKNIFLKRVEVIDTFYPKPGRVLEIGCSTGILLSQLREKGWEVYGSEISEPAAAVALARGLKVETKPFEEAVISQKFDLIIINHTLEHLADPVTVIKKIYTLLEPKGLLLVGVPNFGGLSSCIFRSYWSMLLPEEHRWHFTKKSLTTILEDNNFRVDFTESLSGIWDLKYPFLEIWQAFVSRKKRLFREVITALPDLIVSKLGLGSGLIIVARKN